jgi:hypothetical protein
VYFIVLGISSNSLHIWGEIFRIPLHSYANIPFLIESKDLSFPPGDLTFVPKSGPYEDDKILWSPKTMKKLFSKFTPIQWLAIALIVIGIAIMIPKGRGMMEFSREARYATVNHFQDGNVSPDLLRPWMSIRYVAVAYAVPQQYLFDSAHIQPKKETSMIGIDRLNRQLRLGQADGQPALMKTIRDSIVEYRAHPIVTGLIEQHVEDWMTVQYIANSTGIPALVIFQEIGVPYQGNGFKPLGFLSNEIKYPGGSRALTAAIQKIVDEQGVKPVKP